MRVTKVLFILSAVGSVQAFVSKAPACRQNVSLFSTVAEPPVEVQEEVAAPVESPVASASATSSLTMKKVRKTIAKLSAENFEASLETIEPFLANDAGATIYAKSMRRISAMAKQVGKEIPSGYAKEAKATAKRREKQDAFIKTKEEERLAAEAAASEAADAEAPAEEPVEA